jgi:uridine kinase
MLSALFDNIFQLLESRNDSANSRRPVFVIIDGPAGAGKTTLAFQIVSHFGVGEVIHCDDLYNGWDDALTPTLEQTIRTQVLEPIINGEPIRMRKYDWQLRAYGAEISLPATSLLILEGVGAALKSATQVADLSIWIDIPFDIGLQRVLARDGIEIQAEMLRWMAQQSEFFALHRNQENCSIHLPYGAPAS